MVTSINMFQAGVEYMTDSVHLALLFGRVGSENPNPSTTTFVSMAT